MQSAFVFAGIVLFGALASSGWYGLIALLNFAFLFGGVLVWDMFTIRRVLLRQHELVTELFDGKFTLKHARL